MIYNRLAVLLLSAGMLLSNAGDYSRKLPVFSVETPEKVVALTFNAAWTDGDTAVILDILDEHGIKASFFLCGMWLKKYPDLLRRIYESGHDVGSHGDKHAHVASLSFDNNVKEITGAHEKVKDTLGIDMSLYRGPYGEYSETVLKAAASLGYTMVQWDVDSLDWKNMGEKDILDRVLNHKNLRNGSILLFHTDAKHTASVLERVIAGLKDRGYGFAPVSQLMYKNNYRIDVQGRQHPAGP